MNIRSTILGTTALVVLLTAGAAQSLTGTNTVDSGDIVDGTIKNIDIKPSTITGSRILNNSLTGADMNEATLTLPGVIRTTEVHFEGAKVFGAGTPTRDSTGSYIVDYGIPLKNCTAQVTGGYNAQNGVGYYNTGVHGTVFPGYPTANKVTVYFRNNSGTATDTNFFLTVVCAAGSASHTISSQTSAPSGAAASIGSDAPPQAN